VQQCIRNATQPQAQPPAPQQTTPQVTPATTTTQGLTTADEQAIARQQWTIESFESALSELQSLIQQGKCEAAEDLVDELDEWLDELDSPSPIIRPAGLGPPPRIPTRLIDEWDRRIDEILDSCPKPGRVKLDVSAILGLHNGERARYGYEPLRWSIRLAGNAQTYADQLARTGQLAHASRDGRGIERENISSGLPGWSTNQLLDSWFAERQYFRPGIFPDVSVTGDWYQVGHYSQAIWPTTTSIGCGLSYGSGFSWLVCRYSPGGNKDGKPVGQIQAPEVASVPGSNSNVRPRLIGGDYGLGQSATATDEESLGRRASLFDLGIYAGGAWTSDWFDLEQPAEDGSDCPVGPYDYFDHAFRFSAGETAAPVPADRTFFFYSGLFGEPSLLDTPAPTSPNSYDAMGRYLYSGCRLDF
jgi:uncharacterized protein YkwD